ncbi:MAG TPA: MFS transporter [Asticcacaulis sp.]|nr:MFS transporter [Asticcacaulis sp.]
MAERKTGPINHWAWGAGDLVGAGITAVTSGWLIYFYTTFCGLTAVAAGGLFGISRIFDAFTCPLIGYISDNLRHTWVGRHIGRRKIFLLIAIPLLPSFALMWVSGQTFLYYLCTYLFFELVYNFVLIPWETFPAEMSDDYKEKAKFAGARILCAQASAMLASYLPTVIINYLGKDSATTFLINGAIFGGLASLVILLSVIFTWERPYTDEEKLITPKPLDFEEAAMIPINVFRDLFSTLRIKAFRQHLSIYLGGYISQDIFNGAFAIFVAVVMMGTAAATQVISQMLTTMYFFQFLSVMVAIRVVMRAGPTRAYGMAIASFIVSCAMYYVFYSTAHNGFAEGLSAVSKNIFSTLNPLGHDIGFNLGTFHVTLLQKSPIGFEPVFLFWLFVPVIFAGLGRGTLNYVPWSVYNYLPDVDEAVTGQRREGIFAGVMTLVRKLSQAIAIAAAGWLIDKGGYLPTPKDHPPIHQTPEAVHTIVLVMCLGPAVIMLLGLIVALRFKLNSKSHAVLMGEVERLRNGATEPETPESGKIVEELTGWKYADLWGRKKARQAQA